MSGPTNFVIDPGGRRLYVNNSTADNIAQFAIDPATGELEPTGRTTSVPVPLMMALCTQMSGGHRQLAGRTVPEADVSLR